MTKFWAIVKREYLTRVRTKMFVITTLLGPVMLALFTIVPALVASLKVGVTRVAVIDQTEGEKMYDRVQQSLLGGGGSEDATAGASGEAAGRSVNANTVDRARGAQRASGGSFQVSRVSLEGRSLEQVTGELNDKVNNDQLDSYIVLPENVLEGGEVYYYARNVGDIFTQEQIRSRINSAVREQRIEMEGGNIREKIERIFRPVTMKAINTESGREESGGGGFAFVFGIGLLVYIMIIMYGQVILAAVVEEKETRIAELLFSSIRSFPLMLGKLVGVSLVALTQFIIWGLAFVAFLVYGVEFLSKRGMGISLPPVPPLFYLYFFLFFMLGYFIYATLYALVGSMVTTTQEGGQVAIPILFLLIIGFYFAFPVINSPNSPLAFWVSMVPFFSPITMLVRIVTRTPDLWQIVLSLGIGFATVLFLMWLASRIYRIGMLMYGKRATIPELMRWIKQA
ncbi:MAG TPA: ABC transporter permease [Pyrinomonadaceae bacterium]